MKVHGVKVGGRGLMEDGSGDGVRVYVQLGESCVMVPVLYMCMKDDEWSRLIAHACSAKQIKGHLTSYETVILI